MLTLLNSCHFEKEIPAFKKSEGCTWGNHLTKRYLQTGVVFVGGSERAFSNFCINPVGVS